MDSKDKDNNEQTTPQEFGKPFDDGMKQAGVDPNEERTERLKDAIRKHAERERGAKFKKVKARRRPM